MHGRSPTPPRTLLARPAPLRIIDDYTPGDDARPHSPAGDGRSDHEHDDWLAVDAPVALRPAPASLFDDDSDGDGFAHITDAAPVVSRGVLTPLADADRDWGLFGNDLDLDRVATPPVATPPVAAPGGGQPGSPSPQSGPQPASTMPGPAASSRAPRPSTTPGVTPGVMGRRPLALSLRAGPRLHLRPRETEAEPPALPHTSTPSPAAGPALSPAPAPSPAPAAPASLLFTPVREYFPAPSATLPSLLPAHALRPAIATKDSAPPHIPHPQPRAALSVCIAALEFTLHGGADAAYHLPDALPDLDDDHDAAPTNASPAWPPWHAVLLSPHADLPLPAVAPRPVASPANAMLWLWLAPPLSRRRAPVVTLALQRASLVLHHFPAAAEAASEQLLSTLAVRLPYFALHDRVAASPFADVLVRLPTLTTVDLPNAAAVAFTLHTRQVGAVAECDAVLELPALHAALHQRTELQLLCAAAVAAAYSDALPDAVAAPGAYAAAASPDADPGSSAVGAAEADAADIESEVFLASFHVTALAVCVDYEVEGASLTRLLAGAAGELRHVLCLRGLLLRLPAVSVANTRGWGALGPALVQAYRPLMPVLRTAGLLCRSVGAASGVSRVVQGVGSLATRPQQGAQMIAAGSLRVLRASLATASSVLEAGGRLTRGDCRVPGPGGAAPAEDVDEWEDLGQVRLQSQRDADADAGLVVSDGRTRRVMGVAMGVDAPDASASPRRGSQRGVRGAWAALSQGLERAVHAAVTVPVHAYQQRGGAAGLVAAAKGVPALLLEPTGGTVKAAAVLVGQLLDSIDHDKLRPRRKPGHR
jgi:hypothetical protein